MENETITINGEEITVEEFENAHSSLSIQAATLHKAQMILREQFGETDEVKTLWEMYLKVVERREVYDRISYAMIMNNQMQYITDEEWSAIVD